MSLAGDTDRLLAGMTRRYQKLYGYNPIMVVAPWIGPQAQQRLRENGVAYIDLTGNAWITMENPRCIHRVPGLPP